MTIFAINNRLAGSEQALSSSYKTITAIAAQTSGLRRAWIYELEVGADGTLNTSTDTQVVFDFSRLTGGGTSTSATPNPVDVADTACTTVGSVNYSAEGTITGTITGTLSLIQSVGTSPAVSTLAVPFTPCIPASASNTGIAVNSVAASTGGQTSVVVSGFQL